VGAGFFVRAVLSDGAFPGPYLILFGVTGATYALALGSFSLVAEPPGPSASKRTPLARYLRRAPGLFRTDRVLRDAFISRALIGCAALAGPFYIIYCKNRLGSPDSLAGAYLAAINAGIIIVNLAWARISDRRGAAPLIRAVAITTFLGPALALLIAVLPLSNLAAQNAFFAVFFLIGAAGGGGFAFNNYLMEIAPEEQRPRYFGTMNTFFAFITLLPALGGLLAEATSYQVLFGVSAALTLAGVWTCRRLRPRDA
jgi:MFS family permease